MNSKAARALARRFMHEIRDVIVQGEICGALRRDEPDCKKIVCVVTPAPGNPLVRWGTPVKDLPATKLDQKLMSLREAGKIAPNPLDKAMGPKEKHFIFAAMNIPLELFVANRDKYGLVVAMQTGDARFWRQAITKFAKGGLMPDDAQLWGGAIDSDTLGSVSCPTEAAFFRFLGFGFVPEPRDRNLILAQEMHRQLKVKERESGKGRQSDEGGSVYTHDAEMDAGGKGRAGKSGDRVSWES